MKTRIQNTGTNILELIEAFPPLGYETNRGSFIGVPTEDGKERLYIGDWLVVEDGKAWVEKREL